MFYDLKKSFIHNLEITNPKEKDVSMMNTWFLSAISLKHESAPILPVVQSSSEVVKPAAYSHCMFEITEFIRRRMHVRHKLIHPLLDTNVKRPAQCNLGTTIQH